jgi:hypothetical protein
MNKPTLTLRLQITSPVVYTPPTTEQIESYKYKLFCHGGPAEVKLYDLYDTRQGSDEEKKKLYQQVRLWRRIRSARERQRQKKRA